MVNNKLHDVYTGDENLNERRIEMTNHQYKK